MLTPTAFLIFQDATPPPPVPAAPTGVTATALSGTQIKFDWTDNATDELSYEVQIDTDPGFGTATLTQGLAVDLETYTFTGLVAGTQYYMRARAVNASGNGSWSSAANTFTLGSPPTRLDNVGAFATATDSFRLVWGDDVGDEDYYELERNSASDFTGTSSTTTVTTGTVHYDWTTVPSGTWYVRVRGVSTTLGAAAWRGYVANSASGIYDSDFGFVRVPSSLASPPTAPSSITVTVGTLTATINYAAGSGGGFTGTQIQTSRDASYQDTVDLHYNTGSGPTEADAVTGLLGNTTYYYRLRSIDSTNGDYSAWVTGSFTTLPSVAPSAPTGFAVTATAATTLDFGWTDPSGEQITEVESQIAEDAGYSTGLQSDLSVGVGTQAKQWTGLTEGTLYYSRVRAINAAGNGTYATTTTYTKHAAPSSLAETDNSTFWTLDWTRNSTNNTAVEVHKSTGGGYSLFDTLAADVTTYAVAKEAGALWKVKNTGPGADSDFSNVFTDPT